VIKILPVGLFQVLEGERHQWIPRYDDVQQQGKQLMMTAEKEIILRIEKQLQDLSRRWDALLHRMEQRSCEVEEPFINLFVNFI